MSRGVPRRATFPRARVARVAAVAYAVAWGAAACLPRERTNAACRWTGDAAALAPSGDPARRAHLLTDVRLAWDLGIRYADATVGRPPPSMVRWDSAQRACTKASLAAVARRHGVSPAELAALAGAREPWVDVIAVFLPMAVLVAAAGRVAARRLMAGHSPGVRLGQVLHLAVWALFAAALALMVTQLWGVIVETVRLGNEHISSRGFDLPASRHGWLVWGTAVGLFALGAVSTVRAAAAGPLGGRRRRNG